MTEELKACPFCGANAMAMQDGNGIWAVSCNNDGTWGDDIGGCGMIGPERVTRDKAIAAWNQRHHQADDATVETVERVARALCAASGNEWKEGTHVVHSGLNFEPVEHPLDPFNNHWRAKAKAAIAAMTEDG